MGGVKIGEIIWVDLQWGKVVMDVNHKSRVCKFGPSFLPLVM